VVKFFELFDVEDKVNFESYRTHELNVAYPTISVSDISPLQFDEFQEKKLANKIFDKDSKSLTTLNIYSLTIKNYKAGSDESIELLRTLLLYDYHGIFATKAVKKLIEHHWREVYYYNIFQATSHFIYLFLMWRY
jgi:hypothetical protein